MRTPYEIMFSLITSFEIPAVIFLENVSSRFVMG
jgi:hypothetical protein